MSPLAELLEERREELIRRWTERAASPSELGPHLREFLAALGQALGRAPSGASPASGHPRVRSGAGVETWVREYGELRTLLDTLVREAGLSPTAEDERRLAQCFSVAVAGAVTACAAEQRSRERECAEALRRSDERCHHASHVALEAEQRAQSAIEATRLGIWELQLPSGALLWDPRCRRLFGLPPEVPVDYATFVSAIHPDDRERVERAIRCARAGQDGGTCRVEFRTLGLGDGVERWVDSRGQVFFDDAGRAVRFIGTVLDITACKRLELERGALLERERAARAEAEEANRLKDDFLATVGHELRTPLTAILGWVQLLRSGQLTEERRERALETVERNAQAQAQLVDDLLDVSRGLSGRFALEVETLELAAVVESALESLRPAATAKGVRLQPALDSLACVLGDSTRLQQIVWNLVSNAVKFTPRGGRVQVVVARRDSSVELTVADTGQGISADFLPYVFEHLRPAASPRTRPHGGLGLGLSIVKHLVALQDRKSTRLNSSHSGESRMPSSA